MRRSRPKLLPQDDPADPPSAADEGEIGDDPFTGPRRASKHVPPLRAHNAASLRPGLIMFAGFFLFFHVVSLLAHAVSGSAAAELRNFMYLTG